MNRIQLFFKHHNKFILLLSGILIAMSYVSTFLSSITTFSIISYLIVTILCGIPILCRALSGVRYKVIGIELLVSIAVIGALFIQEYSEAGIVTFLFQLGSYLEQMTLEKTRHSIKSLINMAPVSAVKIENNHHIEVLIDDVKKGDSLLVKAGNKIPVDGYIKKGSAYLDESSITGESKLSHKVEHDLVYASTLLDLGTIEMIASKVGEDTTFAKIISLVEEAQDAKSPIERFIDRFAKYYTPAVALFSLLIYLLTHDIPLSITVLVLACPGALIIGAPVANVAGIGRGAKEGILLKGGDSIHTFAKSDMIIFDKTGTLTQGKPGVVKEYCYTDYPDEVLNMTYRIEKSSDHPLANAIKNYARDQGILINQDMIHSTPEKGLGLKAFYQDKEVYIGNKKLLEIHSIQLNTKQNHDLLTLQNEGMSTIIVAWGGIVQSIYGVADMIRDEAKEALQQLVKFGIKKTMMCTGDNHQTALSVASELNIDIVKAELLPEDKLSEVRNLQSQGHTVTFVGDGINDSPALAAANTGISISSGTDVAIETSDVVLMKADLLYLSKALSLCTQTVHLTLQNIVIALGTVILLLIGLLTGWIHMASGMFIHELSILLVIINAMRILYKKEI